MTEQIKIKKFIDRVYLTEEYLESINESIDALIFLFKNSGFKCSKVDNGDGTFTYSFDWPMQ